MDLGQTAILDNVAHGTVKLRTQRGSAFGDAVNQIPVFTPEFAEIQRHYPILFRRDPTGNQLEALAILGFAPDENLFLAGDRWDAAYIPAWARRGPFRIGFQANEPVIHIDCDHARVARADEGGAPLFLPQGGNAPALEDALQALRMIHLGHEGAAATSDLLDRYGLVETVDLKIHVSDAEVIDFSGFLAITAERIAALDGAALDALNRAGLLEAAIFAAHSLNNMSRLIDRRRMRG